MLRPGRLVRMLGVVALPALVLVGACAGPGDAAGGSEHATFVQHRLEDRTYLFDGYAVTVDSIRMDVDDTYQLVVEVCGAQAICQSGALDPTAEPTVSPTESPGLTGIPGPTESAEASESPGPTGSPSAPSPSASPPPGEAIVVVGGLIRARLTTDMTGTVTPRSSEIQPVYIPEDQATWRWDITPTSSGEYTLTVHLTVLEADSDVPLIADQVLAIPLRVDQTAGKVASQAWFGIKEVAAVLGALGVSVVAVVGFLVRWFIKRRRVQPGGGRGPAGSA